MPGNSYRAVGIVLLLVGGVLAGCRPSKPEADQVILQLNWYHEAEFAGYYVAEAKGFYAGENLEVTIEEGGLDINSKKRVVQGEVDFAVTTFYEHQTYLEKGKPSVAVMAVFQIPPPVLIALTDSGIHEPHDLAGRRVAIKGEPWRQIIYSTLTNAGVDPSEMIEIEVEHDAMVMLYNGEVDVWPGYAANEPIKAQLAGYEVNLIFPANYGVGIYEGLLVVHQDTLDQNSDLVARFVRASLRGYQYALEHPDEAAAIIVEWQPQNSLEFHQMAIRALIPLVDTVQAPIGWIDAERWQQGMGTASTQEHPGYTMDFVEEAQ